MTMKAPSPQLRGFMTRDVNPSQTLLGFVDVDVGVIGSVFVQVLMVIAAAAVRRSAWSSQCGRHLR